MDAETGKTLLAALVIFLGFGVAAYFMPSIMLTLGEFSPTLAGAFAIVFVLAFFGVFWLRGRMKGK
jgi:hypothetical protein